METLFWSLFRRPKLFPLAITLSIYGYHFRKVFEQHFQMIERKSVTYLIVALKSSSPGML